MKKKVSFLKRAEDKFIWAEMITTAAVAVDEMMDHFDGNYRSRFTEKSFGARMSALHLLRHYIDLAEKDLRKTESKKGA